MISYGHQFIDKRDIKIVVDVLGSDWLTQGPKVLEFEKVLTDYCGVKYAVACSNGTMALHLAYLAAGLKEGDEVITTSNTFVATTNMLLVVGSKPNFCDIRLDTYNIDETKIEALINNLSAGRQEKLKAIVPVHFSGQPCEMAAIKKIAKKRGLLVIEDACHALGARYKNYKITIEPDEGADSPNDWENTDIFLVYKHRNFTINREGFDCEDIYKYLNYPSKPRRGEAPEGQNDFDERLEDWENNKDFCDYSDYYIWIVYAYIHGGVILSLNYNGDKWDTSSTGFILAKKDNFEGESKEEVKKIAEGLIKTWNQYLIGEVFWYKIEEPIKYFKISELNFNKLNNTNNLKEIENISIEEVEYEEVDSCGGNYYEEGELLEECKRNIDNLIKENDITNTNK